MDIDGANAFIEIAKNSLVLIKEALGVMPRGKKKDELARLIDEAEKKADAFEVALAIKLGYPVCRRHWPTVIMLEQEKQSVFKCPKCGKEVDTSPACIGRDPVVRSRWMAR